MRTEKKKLAGEISEIRPERLEDSRHMNLDVPDRDQHRCNRTVYVSFRSEDSRCGATPLLLLRDWVRVNRYRLCYYCFIEELSLIGRREIIRRTR